MLTYKINGRGRKLRRGVTQPASGTVAAVLKADCDEVPTCVYNEFVAQRLAGLLRLPVAQGVLVDGNGGYRYASLIAASEGRRLPDLDRSRAPKAASRYPGECAGVFVFDVFIGNWDRSGNIKASLSSPVDFYCAFDHSHSLLFAAQTPHDSIEALRSGAPLMTGHLFLDLLEPDRVNFWVGRVGALLDGHIVESCCPGGDVNAVTVATQQRLARALIARRDQFPDIIGAMLQVSEPSV
jgi:hypothetical protein